MIKIIFSLLLVIDYDGNLSAFIINFYFCIFSLYIYYRMSCLPYNDNTITYYILLMESIIFSTIVCLVI